MFNLSDLLNQSNNSEAMAQMARQFGLNMEQTQAAVQAMLPAFAMGLNKVASDPANMANLFSMFNMDKLPSGQDFISQVFGSNQISNAIAQQTAAMTGLGQDMMKQMMPAVAGMLTAAMASQMAQPNNPLAQMFSTMMGGGKPSNPIGDMLGTFFGGQKQGGSAVGDMLGGLMGTFMGNGQKPAANPMGSLAEMMQQFTQNNPMMGGSKTEGPSPGEKGCGYVDGNLWQDVPARP